MREPLTVEGYEQTKEKLADLERRLAVIEKRTALDPEHLASVRRSYRMMMREYLQDIKLFEAKTRQTNLDSAGMSASKSQGQQENQAEPL